MFRLDALGQRLPPLRARHEEIAPLAERFLVPAHAQWGASGEERARMVCPRMRSTSCRPTDGREMSGSPSTRSSAQRRYARQVSWRSRIFQNKYGRRTRRHPSPRRPSLACDAARSLTDRVHEFEVDLIRDAMTKAHGNRSQAARILRVPRHTLANKIRAKG
jgi:DNA-binding NtrC family response regulator